VSQDGQCEPCADAEDADDVTVVTFPMPAGSVFDWHTHGDHQLAWAASGVLTVRSETTAWVLPPTRALWIPAGVRHETLSEGATVMRTAYIKPNPSTSRWHECTPVAATPLLAELIGYLEDPSLGDAPRVHAETLLIDLLAPVATSTIDVRVPADDRARQVAEALLDDPADDRTLAAWGATVGASDRTLARTFVGDTGLTFGRWRSLVRLRSAMRALAEGQPVANVARQVGYESVSAFVAAFRKETGVTPAAYFRNEVASREVGAATRVSERE
jgi:AraC-like DNA-binding protein/quercetin dioxygenase-like cupin family protein